MTASGKSTQRLAGEEFTAGCERLRLAELRREWYGARSVGELLDLYEKALAERDALREVAEAARDFTDDPGETNEKIDRLNDALAALVRPE